MTAPLVFSIASYQYMGDEICRLTGYSAGEVDRSHFPDGERYQRIVSTCDDREAILIGGTGTEADTLELYDLGCGLVHCGVRRLRLVIPYFGYSTMERAVRPGEVVTAKARARLLSSIPRASAGNHVYLVDLHVDGITHYFEGDVRATHVYAKPVIQAAARRLGGDSFVLACTDAGRAKWVESLALDLGVEVGFVYKRRISGDTTEVSGVSAHVADRPVVIYDDMIRTGGSLIGAARAYREAGCSSLTAICTHGLFTGDALERLRGSGLFERLVATDTHPRVRSLADDFLQVESIAPILAARLEECRCD